jgi:hypothetical protein
VTGQRYRLSRLQSRNGLNSARERTLKVRYRVIGLLHPPGKTKCSLKARRNRLRCILKLPLKSNLQVENVPLKVAELERKSAILAQRRRFSSSFCTLLLLRLHLRQPPVASDTAPDALRTPPLELSAADAAVAPLVVETRNRKHHGINTFSQLTVVSAQSSPTAERGPSSVTYNLHRRAPYWT